MKVFLMHPDQDFASEGPLPPQAEALSHDLELGVLFGAMAAGDGFLLTIARQAILASPRDPEAMLYRQDVLRDCLLRPDAAREIYAVAVEAIEREKKVFSVWAKSADSILNRSLEVMHLFTGLLRRLRTIADEHRAEFHSRGFVTLFDMLARELSDDYFAEIDMHLKRLRFKDGVLMSAGLGKGNKGGDYVLREARQGRRRWHARLPGGPRSSYSFQIADRDMSGWRCLSDLRARGINLVANALAQSTDHVLSFFTTLRAELGFYIACLNLYDCLTAKEEPVCFPIAEDATGRALSFRGLYDVCLSLGVDGRAVGNDIEADGKSLLVITGANQGGKSTFLRSLGLAQLMMQSGMFVPAESFASNVCSAVYTHFKREEDAAMTSGKLDEELRRMSEIANLIAPNALLLMNESFAATNEREGSQIAGEVIRALVESEVRVAVVTHLFELARGLYEQDGDQFLFLRAERRPDGYRTFRIVEGEPLPTSYGKDLYERVLGSATTAT